MDKPSQVVTKLAELAMKKLYRPGEEDNEINKRITQTSLEVDFHHFLLDSGWNLQKDNSNG